MQPDTPVARFPVPGPINEMDSSCPPEIQDPFMRSAWGSMPPETRAMLVQTMCRATPRPENDWRRIPAGSRAPQGNPYLPPQHGGVGQTYAAPGHMYAPPPPPNSIDPALLQDHAQTPQHTATQMQLEILTQSVNVISTQLMATNSRMEDVMSRFDEAPPPQTAAPTNTRGGGEGPYAARGGGVAAKQRRIRGPNEPDEPFQLEAGSFNLAKARLADLTAEQKIARHVRAGCLPSWPWRMT
ncbi:hypothetical protein B0H21DRAFT_891683 [Amylocystis lapponica]|nr:hypothetical protein B0H21DRAFT_891683 [Amylocystis lapponica]